MEEKMKRKSIFYTSVLAVICMGFCGRGFAESGNGTPAADIFLDMYAGGYAGKSHRGTVTKAEDSDSVLGIRFSTDAYTGGQIRFKLNSLATSTEPQAAIKDALIWTDILGEFGIYDFSLKISSGYKSWDSDFYSVSAMGLDDDYIQDDKTQEKMNWRLDFSISPDIFPFTLSCASDLDFGSTSDDSTTVNKGFTFWSQAAVAKVSLADILCIDANLYTSQYYNELNDDSDSINYNHYINHTGMSAGADIFILPFSLRTGCAFEVTHTKTENNMETDIDWQAGIRIEKERIFSAAAAYVHDEEHSVYDKGSIRPAQYIGVQASFDMIDRLSLYGGIGYQFNETVINTEPSAPADRISAETGCSLMPTPAFTITAGWQRGKLSIEAPVNNLTTEDGSFSWGQLFLMFHYLYKISR